MNTPLMLAVFTGIIPVAVYSIYTAAILVIKEPEPVKVKNYPKITVIIPTYNESEVIKNRIKNFKEIVYPSDLIHAVVVDDRSTDNTVELAKKAFEIYGITGEVIVKEKRTGTNSSVNLGVLRAKTDVVVTTDADVVFEKNALDYAIGRLLSDEKIGAVCGELEPVIKKSSFTTSSEKAYRSVYGKMCTWESSIDSTYCFNGPLIALRKKAFSPIPETHGASDAGMALEIIRNGYRCLYEPAAKFYEYITEDLKQQRRQKLRRSARLLEATFYNIDLAFSNSRKFGYLVFPLRILMFFMVPASFFASLILWTYLAAKIGLIYGIGIIALFVLALVSGMSSSNLVSSFIWHQIYLLVSLRYMFKGVHIWKAIDRENV